MSQKGSDTNFKSQELQEILGKIPSGITRFGSLFILLSLLSIIAASAIIKFPSLVKAQLEISAPTPSLAVYIAANTQLKKILVEENQEVKKGDIIILLASEVNETSVFSLERKIDSLCLHPDLLDQISFPTFENLGELQESYKVFLTKLNVKSKTPVSAAEGNSASQIKLADLNSKNSGLLKKSNTCSEELQVLNQNYFAHLDLLKKGVISQSEVDNSMDIFYNKKIVCEKLNVEINDLKIRIKELKAKIAKEPASIKEDVLAEQIDYNAISADLKSKIAAWKNTYLMYAPSAGIVSLNQDYYQDSLVFEDQEALSIVQKNSALAFVAKVNPNDINKVKIGQKVHVKLESSQVILGEVASISPEIKGDYYPVAIDLPTPLQQSNGAEIIIDVETIGSVEIENDKVSFLSIIINKLK